MDIDKTIHFIFFSSVVFLVHEVGILSSQRMPFLGESAIKRSVALHVKACTPSQWQE